MGCFTFFPRTSRDNDAFLQARAGLQDIIAGYRKIARLDLPPGAAHVLANVREHILELEIITREAKQLKTRPWLLPFAQEQHDWEALHPDGGFLLRRQMCMVAFTDDEWAMGCLFISDTGLAFDSGDIPGECISFQTGFIPWQEITGIDKPFGPKTLLTLSLKSAPGRPFSTLRLQLSITGDVEWLEEFWRFRTGLGGLGLGRIRAGSCTVPDGDEMIQAPRESFVPRLLHAQLDHDEHAPLVGSGSGVALAVDEDRTGELSGPSILQRRRHTLRLSATSMPLGPSMSGASDGKLAKSISEAFADTPSGPVAAQVPVNESPLRTEQLPTLTLAQVGAALASDDCVPRCLREGSLAVTDLMVTPWAESRRMPGTWVRRATFRMSLPKDIPRAISRLISLPETSSVTMVYRLRRNDERVVMTSQTCTHEVTFGENFRVQETLLFQPSDGPCLEAAKYAEIIWVAPLPWTHSAIKSFIEKKAKADSTTSMGNFLRIVQEVAAAA